MFLLCLCISLVSEKETSVGWLVELFSILFYDWQPAQSGNPVTPGLPDWVGLPRSPNLATLDGVRWGRGCRMMRGSLGPIWQPWSTPSL